jgi:CheY-like chemotaxis protein
MVEYFFNMAEQLISQDLRVIHIEDDPQWQDIVREAVEEIGATLVLTLDTMEEALAAVILMEKLKIDLVILDGNLTEGEYKGDEARKILEMMAQRGVSATTIGFSGSSIKEADIDLGKGKATELKETITSLIDAE